MGKKSVWKFKLKLKKHKFWDQNFFNKMYDTVEILQG